VDCITNTGWCALQRKNWRLEFVVGAIFCGRQAFSNAICLWPARVSMMNRSVLKTALSMTRHFAFNVGENQSLRVRYQFWRRTGLNRPRLEWMG